MGNLAIIIPEKIPATVSKGVYRAFLGLHKLPDDFLVYYEPLIEAKRPDFLIISPDTGLIAIEIRNWYPGMITAVSDQKIRIFDDGASTEMNPLFHARQYLSFITRRIIDNPAFSSLRTAPGEDGGGLIFPTRSLLLLPNCTIPQLAHHQLGDISSFFNPGCTICREKLLEIEQWEPEVLISFIRSLAGTPGSGSPLSPGQIHMLRAVVHPDIIINPSLLKGSMLQASAGSSALKTLDIQQEKRVYQIRQGHQIVVGEAGTGKTTILAARARILHHHADSRIVVLCSNTVLCEQLRRMLTSYPRINVFSFGEWAIKQGVIRKNEEEGGESDQEYGARVYLQMQAGGEEFHAYDAVLVDEAQDFSPSWILCAREALKDPDGGDLLIVSDGHQGPYGPAGISWKDLGIHARGRISHQDPDLGNNYRNTKEIMNVARLFLHPGLGEDNGDPEGFLINLAFPSRTGLKPLLVWNTTHASQCDYTTFLVRRLLGSLKSAQYLSGLRPDDIAIMYPHAEEQDRKALDRMISELGRFCPVQWVAENNYTHSRIHLPGVKVHDARSIKGMQYRAVMLLFSEYYDSYLNNPRCAADRHLFYIALTRPADFLTIQYTEKTDLIRKLLSSGKVDEFIGK